MTGLSISLGSGTPSIPNLQANPENPHPGFPDFLDRMVVNESCRGSPSLAGFRHVPAAKYRRPEVVDAKYIPLPNMDDCIGRSEYVRIT